MKPHAIGRFVYTGCRGEYLRRLAKTWRVSIRTIAQRMRLPQRRVREVFALKHVSYFMACEYIEGITENHRCFSRAVQRLERRLLQKQ